MEQLKENLSLELGLSKLTAGIVDYGAGNLASLMICLKQLGYAVKVSDDFNVLNTVDIIFIPGVGAYPAAMKALHQKGLVSYLREQARLQRPIIGICLGMQLLASASHEFEYTAGLDIIPGEIISMGSSIWHIGWNTVETNASEIALISSNGGVFYFNHSYRYDGPTRYQVGLSRCPNTIATIIRKNKVVGLQFHPEKSQLAGRILLKNLILELVSNA